LVYFLRRHLAGSGEKIADLYLVRYWGRLPLAGLGQGMVVKVGKARLG